MFSDVLRQLRKEKGYTQSELSKLINSSTSKIAMWETGKRDPVKEDLLVLSELFEVSTDFLLGKTDKRNTYTSNTQISEEGSVIRLMQGLTKDDELHHLVTHDKYDCISEKSLLYLIIYMLKKVNCYYILKQLFVYVFSVLEAEHIIDTKKDVNLSKIRNEIVHNPYSIRDLLERVDNKPKF